MYVYVEVCKYGAILQPVRWGLYPLSGKVRKLATVSVSEQNVAIIQKLQIWTQLKKSVKYFSGYDNNVMILPKLENYFGKVDKLCQSGYYWE